MTIIRGDATRIPLPDNSVDAVVTDPPYELNFMGRSWDSSGVAYQPETWSEVLRVLKPGGHLVSFGGTRTYHRMTCAIEDAGFEVRDCLAWLYGSGFPKSLDVSKALDKMVGAEREVVGEAVYAEGHVQRSNGTDLGRMNDDAWTPTDGRLVTTPATPEAQQWQGWGTALKPAHEPIVLARKPLTGTVAQNVLRWGTGALNVDGCRVETAGEVRAAHRSTGRGVAMQGNADGSWSEPYQPGDSGAITTTAGRWPPNVCLSEEAARLLDEQSGERKAGVAVHRNGVESGGYGGQMGRLPEGTPDLGYGDTGGASRFMYVAKASSAERNRGLVKPSSHPTVKPLALMRWLVRLVTPPGGLVLDPFLGSGTTVLAAHHEGFRAIGIEREAEYVEIAKARCAQPVQQGML